MPEEPEKTESEEVEEAAQDVEAAEADVEGHAADPEEENYTDTNYGCNVTL